jgi:hypothetical protein
MMLRLSITTSRIFSPEKADTAQFARPGWFMSRCAALCFFQL